MTSRIRILSLLLILLLSLTAITSCSNGRNKNYQSDADVVGYQMVFEDGHRETVVIGFKNEVSATVTELIFIPGATEEKIKEFKDQLNLGEKETVSVSGELMTVERNADGKYKDIAFGKTKSEISEYFLSLGYTAAEIEVDESTLNN